MALTAYIDAGRQEVNIIETPESVLKKFLGSRGYAAKILYDSVGPDVAPFDPGNHIIFSTGPFTGTGWPTGSRMTISAKSPATEAYGYGNVGGFIGTELRKAGFDAVVVHGKSEKPFYVLAEDGTITLKPADDLWGTDAIETEKLLKERYPKGQVCCVGQGGENRVYIAGVITDGGRAVGRTGMGAVMGDKMMKALVARGSERVPVPAGFRQVAVEKSKKLMQNPGAQDYKRWGTSILMNYKNPKGDIPTRNFKESQAPVIKKVNAQALDKYVDRTTGCFGCPIRCGRHSKVESGPYKCESEGPEYETINSLAPMVGNDDMEVVLYANELCNRYGIDTISIGSLISFAMECHENGLLDDPDLNLEWGDIDTILGLIKAVSLRQGLGDILADGVKRAAEKIHPDAKKYALHVKGLETPRQEPRTCRGLALCHATSNRGADHLYGLPTIDLTRNKEAAARYFPHADESILEHSSQKYKPEVVFFTEAFSAINDSLGVCKFSTLEAYALGPEDIVDGLNAFFPDASFTFEEIMLCGERIVNMERMYNVRHGFSRKDDTLHDRFLKEPATVYEEKEGELTKKVVMNNLVVELDEMLDGYYEKRGWTLDGIPTPETLKKLGLDELIKDLP